MATSNFTIQHVTSNPTIYVKPRFMRLAIEAVIGNGILTAEGESHRRQRKVLNPAFGIGYIREIVPIFSAKATDVVTLLFSHIESQSAEGIDVLPLLKRATLDIISSSGVFSRTTRSLTQALGTISIQCALQMIPSLKPMGTYRT